MTSESLTEAYELTLSALDLRDHDDPIAIIVAKEIREIGFSEGEPIEIAQEAINRLRGLGQSL